LVYNDCSRRKNLLSPIKGNMFYTPKHCCECGEKIQRDVWKWSTSRRFCETCESEFKGQDWLLRAIIGLGILGVLYGFGSYLKQPDKPSGIATTQLVSGLSNNNRNVQNSQVSSNTDVLASAQKQTATNIKDGQSNTQSTETALAQKPPQSKQGLVEKQQNTETETVYFCGAQTKKGTPCTRRVKGNERCWQHKGQAAMLPPEKLVASR
jgi:hypothetical protein